MTTSPCSLVSPFYHTPFPPPPFLRYRRLLWMVPYYFKICNLFSLGVPVPQYGGMPMMGQMSMMGSPMMGMMMTGPEPPFQKTPSHPIVYAPLPG